MRSSAILSIIALAAAVPSLAAPVAQPASYAKRQTQETNTPPVEESGAVSSANLGNIATIAGFAAPLVNSAIDWWRNRGKREFEEVFAREFDEQFARELMAREAPSDDQSGAFLGLLLRAIPAALSLFGGNKREFEEVFAREFDEQFARELMAREASSDDQSGAFLGLLLRAIPAALSLFGGNKREFEDVFARELDESGALSLGSAANIASIGSSIVSVFHNLFGGNSQQKRELEALLARGQQELDESGAISFGTLANIGSLIGSGISILHNAFSGNKREFEELLARELEESGALSLGSAANIASLGSSIVSVFHNLFGGNSQQKREFEDLLARALADAEESGALSLGAAANAASLGSSIVSIFHNIFGKREADELLARHFGVQGGFSGFPGGRGGFGGPAGFRGGFPHAARSLNELD